MATGLFILQNPLDASRQAPRCRGFCKSLYDFTLDTLSGEVEYAQSELGLIPATVPQAAGGIEVYVMAWTVTINCICKNKYEETKNGSIRDRAFAAHGGNCG